VLAVAGHTNTGRGPLDLGAVFAGLARSASIAFAAPYAMPVGVGIATSAANIDEKAMDEVRLATRQRKRAIGGQRFVSDLRGRPCLRGDEHRDQQEQRQNRMM